MHYTQWFHLSGYQRTFGVKIETPVKLEPIHIFTTMEELKAEDDKHKKRREEYIAIIKAHYGKASWSVLSDFYDKDPVTAWKYYAQGKTKNNVSLGTKLLNFIFQ